MALHSEMFFAGTCSVTNNFFGQPTPANCDAVANNDLTNSYISSYTNMVYVWSNFSDLTWDSNYDYKINGIEIIWAPSLFVGGTTVDSKVSSDNGSNWSSVSTDSISTYDGSLVTMSGGDDDTWGLDWGASFDMSNLNISITTPAALVVVYSIKVKVYYSVLTKSINNTGIISIPSGSGGVINLNT